MSKQAVQSSAVGPEVALLHPIGALVPQMDHENFDGTGHQMLLCGAQPDLKTLL